ncbi:MAG: uracil-DNA glycosylase [Terrimicrobiaceae bacterium]|nr:uracil-DNA glycosylase [Terrimicrobiaceae bacterium]
MSDVFQRALDQTVPVLLKMKSGLKRPPTASRSSLAKLAASASPKAEAVQKARATAAPGAASRKWTWESLEKAVLSCTKCPHLVRSRTQVVFGVGNREADLMFVGEAPGADEDAQGEPFVGRAGQLLTKIIQAMGFERSDIYIANVLKCRPDMPEGESGNRKPKAEEMATCLPWLREQIALVRPKVIVALGSTAAEGLLETNAPMRELRGRWQDFEGTPVMVTYHPAYLLRNQSITEKRKVWEDMLLVLEKLGCRITEKQRRFFTQNA